MLKLSKEEMQEAADYTKAMHILFSAGVVGNFTQAMKKVKEFEDAETALTFANMSYTMAEMGIGSMEVQQEFMKELIKPQVQPLSEDVVDKVINIIYDTAAQKGIIRAENHGSMKNPISITMYDEPIRVAKGSLSAKDMWKRINALVHMQLQDKYSGRYTVRSIYVTVITATTQAVEFMISFDLTFFEG